VSRRLSRFPFCRLMRFAPHRAIDTYIQLYIHTSIYRTPDEGVRFAFALGFGDSESESCSCERCTSSDKRRRRCVIHKSIEKASARATVTKYPGLYRVDVFILARSQWAWPYCGRVSVLKRLASIAVWSWSSTPRPSTVPIPSDSYSSSD